MDAFPIRSDYKKSGEIALILVPGKKISYKKLFSMF